MEETDVISTIIQSDREIGQRVVSGYRRARREFESTVNELMRVDCGDFDCDFCPWFHENKGCVLTALSAVFSDHP